MKKVAIALSLALVTILCLGTVALAWDFEDSCVAGNEDFIWGIGWDGGVMESYFGEQSWSYFETPNDGYNLYRDNVTNTGNLDAINGMYTRTPDAIGLSDSLYFDMDGGLWYMYDESLDTWYWATEARGYNGGSSGFSLPQSGMFLVAMCGHGTGYWQNYHWVEDFPHGKTLAEPVFQTTTYRFNGFSATYALAIPEGTEITGYYIPKANALDFKIVDGQFHISPSLKFSQPAKILELVDGEWVEVLSFTQVLNGKAS